MRSEQQFIVNSIAYSYKKIARIFQRLLNKELKEDVASSSKNPVGPIMSALRREKLEKKTNYEQRL